MLKCDWTHVDARSVMGTVRNLALVGWRDAPDAGDIRRWRSLAHTMDRAYPHGTACIDLVVAGTPSFSNEMRHEAEQLASDPRVFSLGIAHVIELAGFGGVAVRAFISTVLLVARPAAPAKVFGDSRSASRWLLPKLGQPASRTENVIAWSENEVAEAYRALAAKLVE